MIWAVRCVALLVIGSTVQAEELLPRLTCVAEQTGGFHDYPEGEEVYEPALFHPRSFELEENQVFMLNLLVESPGSDPGGDPSTHTDLYLTLRFIDDSGDDDSGDKGPSTEETELECRRVRGVDGTLGYSCVNLPPSEMLLLNAQSLRFTRTGVGGWTFAGASDASNGDSIFVEYGRCSPFKETADPPGD